MYVPNDRVHVLLIGLNDDKNKLSNKSLFYLIFHMFHETLRYCMMINNRHSGFLKRKYVENHTFRLSRILIEGWRMNILINHLARLTRSWKMKEDSLYSPKSLEKHQLCEQGMHTGNLDPYCCFLFFFSFHKLTREKKKKNTMVSLSILNLPPKMAVKKWTDQNVRILF